MKTIGIVAHSAEGAALCFLTAYKAGASHLGPHMHPPIVMSAIPMGLSLPGWESDDHDLVAKYLAQGVEQVAQAGADFYVCPDNTAHIVLEQIAEKLPIPGLHIADVVCDEIVANHWTEVALLGTRWTMDGPVYANALQRRHLEKLIPPQGVRKQINAAIFEELCQGIFSTQTTRMFSRAIDDLGTRGAECVILGCTEIPLIIDSSNASLPVLDSTRLLAEHAVDVALDAHELQSHGGWILGNTH